MARFVNPYNFVPFGKTGATRESREQTYEAKNALKTGWLTVQMEVKTPVIVPDGAHPRYVDPETGRELFHPTEAEKKKAHKIYDFYTLGEGSNRQYVIPGSEIRGMIRSVYEAVTDSCLPFLPDNKPISQRVPVYGSLQRRGLLEYKKEENTWILWNTYADKQSADVLGRDICINNRKYFCGEYISNKGYVQCNVPISKSNYHVAFLTQREEEHRWEQGDTYPYDKMRSALKRDGVSGNQKNPNDIQRKELLMRLEQVKDNGGMIPVWFVTVFRNHQKLVYLSNSSIGRIAQYRKWEDIFDSNHLPCSDTGQLCPACLLFGTTSGDGMKTRVRFTDALSSEKLETDRCLLDILGQPRTSAFEFYLRRPVRGATYWNFDFYGIKKINPYTQKEETEYHDLSQATPRGRKMYWHSQPKTTARRSRLNSSMECVKKGMFTFQVYFDRITQDQLDTMIWAICLGENTADSTRWHKIGHARPLGYGSVKLCVLEKVVRNINITDGRIVEKLDREVGKQIKPRHTEVMIPKESDTYRAFVALCDKRSTEQKEVRYPRKIVKGDDSVYQWFSQNRKNSSYLECLPEPYDKDITLEGSWFDKPVHTQEQQGPVRMDRQIIKQKEDLDQTGIMDKIIAERGFGFIRSGNKSYFVHIRAFPKGEFEKLSSGTPVRFRIGKGRDGKTCAEKARIDKDV